MRGPGRRRGAQENNAESALEALKEMQSEHAKCIRSGVLARAPQSNPPIPSVPAPPRGGGRHPAPA